MSQNESNNVRLSFRSSEYNDSVDYFQDDTYIDVANINLDDIIPFPETTASTTITTNSIPTTSLPPTMSLPNSIPSSSNSQQRSTRVIDLDAELPTTSKVPTSLPSTSNTTSSSEVYALSTQFDGLFKTEMEHESGLTEVEETETPIKINYFNRGSITSMATFHSAVENNFIQPSSAAIVQQPPSPTSFPPRFKNSSHSFNEKHVEKYNVAINEEEDENENEMNEDEQGISHVHEFSLDVEPSTSSRLSTIGGNMGPSAPEEYKRKSSFTKSGLFRPLSIAYQKASNSISQFTTKAFTSTTQPESHLSVAPPFSTSPPATSFSFSSSSSSSSSFSTQSVSFPLDTPFYPLPNPWPLQLTPLCHQLSSEVNVELDRLKKKKYFQGFLFKADPIEPCFRPYFVELIGAHLVFFQSTYPPSFSSSSNASITSFTHSKPILVLPALDCLIVNQSNGFNLTFVDTSITLKPPEREFNVWTWMLQLAMYEMANVCCLATYQMITQFPPSSSSNATTTTTTTSSMNMYEGTLQVCFPGQEWSLVQFEITKHREGYLDASKPSKKNKKGTSKMASGLQTKEAVERGMIRFYFMDKKKTLLASVCNLFQAFFVYPSPVLARLNGTVFVHRPSSSSTTPSTSPTSATNTPTSSTTTSPSFVLLMSKDIPLILKTIWQVFELQPPKYSYDLTLAELSSKITTPLFDLEDAFTCFETLLREKASTSSVTEKQHPYLQQDQGENNDEGFPQDIQVIRDPLVSPLSPLQVAFLSPTSPYVDLNDSLPTLSLDNKDSTMRMSSVVDDKEEVVEIDLDQVSSNSHGTSRGSILRPLTILPLDHTVSSKYKPKSMLRPPSSILPEPTSSNDAANPSLSHRASWLPAKTSLSWYQPEDKDGERSENIDEQADEEGEEEGEGMDQDPSNVTSYPKEVTHTNATTAHSKPKQLQGAPSPIKPYAEAASTLGSLPSPSSKLPPSSIVPTLSHTPTSSSFSASELTVPQLRPLTMYPEDMVMESTESPPSQLEPSMEEEEELPPVLPPDVQAKLLEQERLLKKQQEAELKAAEALKQRKLKEQQLYASKYIQNLFSEPQLPPPTKPTSTSTLNTHGQGPANHLSRPVLGVHSLLPEPAPFLDDDEEEEERRRREEEEEDDDDEDEVGSGGYTSEESNENEFDEDEEEDSDDSEGSHMRRPTPSTYAMPTNRSSEEEELMVPTFVEFGGLLARPQVPLKQKETLQQRQKFYAQLQEQQHQRKLEQHLKAMELRNQEQRSLPTHSKELLSSSSSWKSLNGLNTSTNPRTFTKGMTSRTSNEEKERMIRERIEERQRMEAFQGKDPMGSNPRGRMMNGGSSNSMALRDRRGKDSIVVDSDDSDDSDMDSSNEPSEQEDDDEDDEEDERRGGGGEKHRSFRTSRQTPPSFHSASRSSHLQSTGGGRSYPASSSPSSPSSSSSSSSSGRMPVPLPRKLTSPVSQLPSSTPPLPLPKSIPSVIKPSSSSSSSSSSRSTNPSSFPRPLDTSSAYSLSSSSSSSSSSSRRFPTHGSHSPSSPSSPSSMNANLGMQPRQLRMRPSNTSSSSFLDRSEPMNDRLSISSTASRTMRPRRPRPNV